MIIGSVNVRPVTTADAPALAALLNEIIARGGTTAFEQPFTPERLAASMLTGPDVICCFVAESDDHERSGFQTVVRSSALPVDMGDIATFSRVGGTQRGIGSALFAATREAAVAAGLAAINATIRADNVGGLAYYTCIGFLDYSVERAVPLRDGTQIDRIVKRFDLA